MPSSTSSSDAYSYEDRPVPEIAWKKALLLAVGLMIIGTAVWEYNARVIWGYEAEPYIDSPALWAIHRRRVDNSEAVVAAIGSSRRHVGRSDPRPLGQSSHVQGIHRF